MTFLQTEPSDVLMADIEMGVYDELTQGDLTDLIGDQGGACSDCVVPPEPITTVEDPFSMDLPDPNETEDETKSVATCALECLGQNLLPLGVGTGMMASGSVPKRLVGLRRGMGGASPFTTVPSIIAHNNPKLRGMRVPRGIPNVAPRFRGGVPVGLTRTTSLVRFVGRWIPGLGWGLLAADAIIIANCTSKCASGKSIWGHIVDAIFPPAY